MACFKHITHNFEELLFSDDRDYLIKNGDDFGDYDESFDVDYVKEKTVGLYFSAAWSGPCKRFTPTLIEAYNEIVSSTDDFEIIFVSADEDEDSFDEHFSKMPWMAIPFSDSETRSRLDELFEVKGLPHLAIVDGSGKLVVNNNGVEIVREYGAEAFPFTPDRVQSLKHRDEASKTKYSLTSILVSRSRDFVVSSNGNEVPITDLEGKTVGLYFSMFSYKACMDFTPKLMEVYQKLKADGESFEIVMIPLDDEQDEESFHEEFKSIPWLSLPFNDKICRKLVRFFDLSTLPTLAIIGEDGKLLYPDVKEAIEEHGALAFPFTAERFQELQHLVIEKEKAQTLESILVSGNQDFAIDRDGAKIPVANLVGKNVLLYFSAYWSSPCRAFLAELMKANQNIKAKDEGMEVIFISSDRNEASFNEFFSKMPWLALPFKDSRIGSLKRAFKVLPGVPTVVAIGPCGRTVTTNARDLIKYYGAEAYPFTEERLNEMAAGMAERLPRKVKHGLHEEHELELVDRKIYTCNGCYERGRLLSFCCIGCDFDLHPQCALGDIQQAMFNL